MAKLVHDDVLDASLSYISANADWISVCEGAPTTYEHAHSDKGVATGKALANSAPDFTGPLNGDGGGRKLTIDEEAIITVDETGDADHVALCDVGATKLLFVTTCTLQELTQGNTVTIPTWDIEIGDPS